MPSCRNPSPSHGNLRRKTLTANGPIFRWQSTGNSLVSVLRAVEAGLGVSILPVAKIAPYAVEICRQFEPVPPMVLSGYAWEQDAATNELLSALTEIVSLERAASSQPGSMAAEA